MEYKNIKILDTNIDVSKILNQLKQYPEDWGSQKRGENVDKLDPSKYIVTVDVLQLIIGGIYKIGEHVKNSELCIKTPAYYKHTEVINYLQQRFTDIHRCGFLSLPIGEIVGSHIDEGSYYLSRDRYHLSIQGTYRYNVGDESIIVYPGTLFWFNNKLHHSAENIGDEVRITFVFDVPHGKN